LTSGASPSLTVTPDKSVDGFTLTLGSAEGDSDADGDADGELDSWAVADADADALG